jgi:hypothetical protein
VSASVYSWWSKAVSPGLSNSLMRSEKRALEGLHVVLICVREACLPLRRRFATSVSGAPTPEFRGDAATPPGCR